jgi:hypothetical protein
MPKRSSADAGYFSEANVTNETLRRVDLFVPPSRQKRGQSLPLPVGDLEGLSVADRMRRKLAEPDGRDVYKMRKAIVEPVFGQIKQARGFRRFSFRGLANVAAEWMFVCATHNLLKIFRSAASLTLQPA